MRLIFLVRVTTPKLPLYSKFWSIYSVTLLQNEKFYEISSRSARTKGFIRTDLTAVGWGYSGHSCFDARPRAFFNFRQNLELFRRRRWRLVRICPIANQIWLFTLSLLFCIFIKTAAYLWADTNLDLRIAVALPGQSFPWFDPQRCNNLFGQ